MTDRINYLIVALDKDFRIDDVQPLIDAIAMLRHVLAVTPHVVDGSDWTATQRSREAISGALMELLQKLT